MQSKLRKLAEEMVLAEQDLDKWRRHFSEELLAILDAEDDGGVVSDEAVLQVCMDYYGEPAWKFMSHKAGCLGRMRAALEHFSTYSAEAVRDGERLKGLRDLCGYVENGSSTVVKLFQDDATRSWFCKVGSKDYWSSTFAGAIDAARKGERYE